VGGTLVLGGMFLMAYNVAKTLGQGRATPAFAPAAATH
jgi:cbb3-type cytochrome oxidase subunit 1